MFSSVLLIVLQLCSLQLMVLTKPTCPVKGSVVQSAHHLLRDVGVPFPVHCVQYNVNISFPDSAFPASAAKHSECRQALCVVYKFLNGTGKVFAEHDLPVGEGGLNWDEKKLDDFQNLQDRLLTEGECLSNVDSSEVFSSYFSNVTAILQQQDSATCGWMVVRRDMLWVLKSALQKYHRCFIW
uniref:Interferon c n=1 Tax=Channa argus TaxID=215402 RepID=A0A8G0W199_CHAAH|nr:interferon c [Channa argus]